MGSFYDDFKKKQNKRQNKPTLLNVPHVVPQKPAHQDAQRRRTIESSSACRRTRMRRGLQALI